MVSMTTEAETAPAEQPPAVPKLIHRGVYALYETPAGGLHLSYRRTHTVAADGQVGAIDSARDEHLPDIPQAAIPMVSSFLEHGFPPAILAMLGGKMSPMAMVKAARDMLPGGGDGAE